MKAYQKIIVVLLMLWLLVGCVVNSQLKSVASKQVSDLKKNGVVLVRLHEQEKKINHLRKTGNRRLAQKIEDKQKNLNQELVNAFIENFTFCPVYFFYAKDSKKILNQEFEGIFLNKDLAVDSSVNMTNENFAIAELSWTTPDTIQHFSETYTQKDSTGNYVRRKRYYTGSDISFEALLLRDNNFAQFHKPFPAYVKKYVGGVERSSNSMVQILNKGLERSFQQYQEKQAKL